MANIKRVNLCFDIDRSDDKKAYDILQGKRNKTAYVTDIIIGNLEKNKVDIDIEILKQVIKEAVFNLNITTDMNTGQYQNDNEDIPEDVFDIISNM
ncbi:hypothetical protein [Defluviitalea saccharophila]|uniref:Uncharacterized protein n=1 Tax=Defluviitalea saccharophila TaxID=879970 RepID=A0ABZ2Y2W6_9FIRM